VTANAPMRILTVCTANVCRSPVAERLLARRLAEVGLPAVVRSAGTHGGSLPVHPHTVEAASRIGVELSDHVSRALTTDLLETDGADLVITMTREHLRHAVALHPTVWARAFTLKELVRRASAAGSTAGDGLAAWVGAMSVGRQAIDLMHPDPVDDVADPYGGAAGGHHTMVSELDALCTQLAHHLAAPDQP
jgi:protein-tyrosine phosphatase